MLTCLWGSWCNSWSLAPFLLPVCWLLGSNLGRLQQHRPACSSLLSCWFKLNIKKKKRQSSSSGKPEPWMKLYNSYRSKCFFFGEALPLYGGISYIHSSRVARFSTPIFGRSLTLHPGRSDIFPVYGTIWNLKPPASSRPLKIRAFSIWGRFEIFFRCPLRLHQLWKQNSHLRGLYHLERIDDTTPMYWFIMAPYFSPPNLGVASHLLSLWCSPYSRTGLIFKW